MRRELWKKRRNKPTVSLLQSVSMTVHPLSGLFHIFTEATSFLLPQTQIKKDQARGRGRGEKETREQWRGVSGWGLWNLVCVWFGSKGPGAGLEDKREREKKGRFIDVCTPSQVVSIY